MKDALGKEIILGQTYGYANNTNGYNNVVIGVAIKFTEKGLVTIKILERKQSWYLSELESIVEFESPTVTLKPMMLFPIL